MYQQKLSPFWWTKNPRTILYFIRELTGAFIALHFILYAAFLIEGDILGFLGIGTYISLKIGIVAAPIHTLTWFWVTMKISPVPLSPILRAIGFFGLIGVWLFTSYFILNTLYVQP